jgi:hypothetical protein
MMYQKHDFTDIMNGKMIFKLSVRVKKLSAISRSLDVKGFIYCALLYSVTPDFIMAFHGLIEGEEKQTQTRVFYFLNRAYKIIELTQDRVSESIP